MENTEFSAQAQLHYDRLSFILNFHFLCPILEHHFEEGLNSYLNTSFSV